MIEAVLFDLDETLLDRRVSLVRFLADQHARHAERLGAVAFDAWRDRFLALDRNGQVPKRVVYPALLAAYGSDLSLADTLVAEYLSDCCRFAQPVPGMAETLGALRAQELALGVITNGGTEFQSRHIASLELARWIDVILISEAEGLRKPEPALFLRAAEQLGVAPEACLFVGDNPVADVLGAHGAGMHTAWYARGAVWPGSVPCPGVSIGGIADVLDVLTSLSNGNIGDGGTLWPA